MNTTTTTAEDEDCVPTREQYVALQRYLGLPFHKATQSQMETELKPFRVTLYAAKDFNNEEYGINQIRCVVENGLIVALAFN